MVSNQHYFPSNIGVEYFNDTRNSVLIISVMFFSKYGSVYKYLMFGFIHSMRFYCLH